MAKRYNKNIWKIIGVYTSAIIGASFVSGRELLQFFAGYGAWGVAGLVVTGVFFALAGWAVLDICFTKRITNGTDLLNHVLGEHIGVIVEVSAVFLMFILYSAMMAGAGASLKQYTGLPFFIGVIIASALAFAALLFDLNGLIAVNANLAPFLAAGGLMIGFMSFINQFRPVFASNNQLHWLYAAFTYAAYNIVTSVPILSNMSVLLENRKDAMKSGLLSGFVMTAIGLCMIYPLYLNYANVRHTEIPLINISSQFGHIFKIFHILIILAAIFTIAMSTGFSFIQWLSKFLGLKPIYAKIVLVFSGLLCAHIGFSIFISKIYLLFAVIGLIETASILTVWIKKHGKA